MKLMAVCLMNCQEQSLPLSEVQLVYKKATLQVHSFQLPEEYPVKNQENDTDCFHLTSRRQTFIHEVYLLTPCTTDTADTVYQEIFVDESKFDFPW